MTKSVVIVLIYFLVFLWDLFVMGLVFSCGDLIKIAKSHVRSTSTCQKLKSQGPAVKLKRHVLAVLVVFVTQSTCE